MGNRLRLARYAQHDALGNAGVWTDSAGEIVAASRYEPFGAQETLGAGTQPVYGYVGRHGVRDDGDAGLLLMGHRYYDPALGRFLSRDPQPGLVVAPRTQHPYVYVGNDPVNRIDPLGLSWWDQLKKGVGSVIPQSLQNVWNKASGWAKRNLHWSRRGAWVDQALSLHPGYYLAKQVTYEMNVLLGRPPEEIDWMLQQRYAVVVDTAGRVAVEVGISVLCPALGVALDGYQAVAGIDWGSGEKVADWARLVAFAGLMWNGVELLDDVADTAHGASLSQRLVRQEEAGIARDVDELVDAAPGGRLLGGMDEMADIAIGGKILGGTDEMADAAGGGGALARAARTQDPATPKAPRSTLRRAGLPKRTAYEHWIKGYLTDEEWAFFRQMAGPEHLNKRIVLSGSLSETYLGLARRYNPKLHAYLPEYRAGKWQSGLIDEGIGDIDLWHGPRGGEKLTPEEVDYIRERLPESLKGFEFKHPRNKGYNTKLYPKLETFAKKGGALVFEPDGTVWRIPAPWQQRGWPQRTNLLNLEQYRAISMDPDLVRLWQRGRYP